MAKSLTFGGWWVSVKGKDPLFITQMSLVTRLSELNCLGYKASIRSPCFTKLLGSPCPLLVHGKHQAELLEAGNKYSFHWCCHWVWPSQPPPSGLIFSRITPLTDLPTFWPRMAQDPSRCHGVPCRHLGSHTLSLHCSIAKPSCSPPLTAEQTKPNYSPWVISAVTVPCLFPPLPPSGSNMSLHPCSAWSLVLLLLFHQLLLMWARLENAASHSSPNPELYLAPCFDGFRRAGAQKMPNGLMSGCTRSNDQNYFHSVPF